MDTPKLSTRTIFTADAVPKKIPLYSATTQAFVYYWQRVGPHAEATSHYHGAQHDTTGRRQVSPALILTLLFPPSFPPMLL
jgi:hypothetical protein